MEDVVPGDVGPLLEDDGRPTEQLTLDGRSEAARTSADDANLLSGEFYAGEKVRLVRQAQQNCIC